VPASMESVDVFNLINEVIELTRYMEGSRQPIVNVLVEKEMKVISDESRLRVILNNLLSNSLKYSDSEKDEVAITIAASVTSGVFTFSVEDNGVGIPEDQGDKIFNMFYRASEKATGSGLGLYIVKESLEKLNGSVRYESAPGKGSIFIVTIPVGQ